MRKIIPLALLVAGLLAIPAAAQAKTLPVHVTIPNANVVTNPPGLFDSQTPPPLGAYTFAGFGTAEGPGNNDGKIHFHGILTGSDSLSIITAVITLPKGSIHLNGLSTEVADDEYYAIIGGTRKYRGIKGDAKLFNEQSADGPNGYDSFDLKLKF